MRHRSGTAWCGWGRRGQTGGGQAGRGAAGAGGRGKAWLGVAWLGGARQGKAGRGKVGQGNQTARRRSLWRNGLVATGTDRPRHSSTRRKIPPRSEHVRRRSKCPIA